ncbi:uncharacterized protein LOC116182671 [Photinus pyralis]|uniref:uncharacterized protein LOC116182671 n=1 Tax=Photinus pyralis TaxID=7054 RepID=UPI001266E798|nr:uncharacterized protein LOC116182671 [Photinus pyralis]
MYRRNRKVVGGRSYLRYNPDNLEQALEDVANGATFAAASRKNFPRSTLQDKWYGRHGKPVGHPTVLNRMEEAVIVDTINELVKWSYPLSKLDLRLIIKGYLDKQGKTTCLKDNMPGKDFIEYFMSRHNLSQRLATNISRSRASVSREVVTDFFNNVQEKLESTPPNQIFNFDETNVTDDPGAKKVVVLRGTKRVERVMEHSKVAISLMFCISASGDILPPFVFYKTENLYETWCEGGPPGSKYDVQRQVGLIPVHLNSGFAKFFSLM